MKKTLTAAALLAALLMAGCSGNGTSGSGDSSSATSSDSSAAATAESTATAKEKAEKLLADVEFAGEMVEVTGENMELRLGFTADGLTDYVAYTCGSGAFPDEFGVFVAESQTKANEVKTALESRIETQKSTYQDYTPEEMYKFDDCFVKLNGTTVYYAITADNTKAEEILK
ncbi:MAG TPA: hypothetical protein DDY65_05110 [Ruminococcaceae bacterium]|jgi:predicted small secreted protein|nr:hypothetical protein [Oscillospiraceae bacterium]